MTRKILLLNLLLVLFTTALHAQEECGMQGALKSVTFKKAGAKELLVFEFISDAPVVNLAAAKPPFTMDPSDEKVIVKGQKFREITFMSSSWVCSIPLKLKGLGTGKIMGFKNAGQFEGYFTYVLGYKKNAAVSGPVTTTKGNKQYVTITVQ